mgnify:CR=1 FL=1
MKNKYNRLCTELIILLVNKTPIKQFAKDLDEVLL